jgi:hypothetical protein
MGALSVLAIAVALLVLPAGAAAKFTCEARGAPPDGTVLHGLPAKPIAGQTYALSVTLPADGVNSAPYLGAEYCGDPRGRGRPAGAGGWFRRVRGTQRDVYTLSLRIPKPGRWALSFMDLDGTFHDLGLRSVPPAAHADLQPASLDPSNVVARRSPGGNHHWAWLSAGGVLFAAAAGLALAARTRRTRQA